MERTRIALDGLLARQTVDALSDESSRRILLSAQAKGKTVQEISIEQAFPLSTCYRRARSLADQGLLVVERIVIASEGSKNVVYRSSFRIIEMSSDFNEASITAELNEDVSEKFRSKWLCHSYQGVRR